MTIWILAVIAIGIGQVTLAVLFWRSFSDDRHVHPIYRDAESRERELDDVSLRRERER